MSALSAKRNSIKQMDSLLKEGKIKRDFEKITLVMYIEEFQERISNLLIQSESEFMVSFSKRMTILVKEKYPDNEFDNDILNITMKESERKVYDALYKPLKTIFFELLEEYERKIVSFGNKFNHSQSSMYITNNFRKHCLNCDDFATHSCGGKFIPIYTNYLNYGKISEISNFFKLESNGLKLDPNQTNESLSFVICVNCQKSFLSKEIEMWCYYCNSNYLSTTLRREDSQLLPATWESYHCGALLNDTMKCISCKSMFFINLQTHNLECKNCELVCDPLTIIWTCFLCTSEFNSNAKIYNPLEFVSVNRAIKNALLTKILVKPLEIPCCKIEISKTSFYHKKECNGLLYDGFLDEEAIVVCEKCKAMNFYFKFLWTCPQCFKRFNLKNLINKKASSMNYDSSIHEKAIGRSFNSLDFNSNSNFNENDLKKSPHKTPNLSKQALMFKFQNEKSISMMKYTKILNKKTSNETTLDDKEELNFTNNVLTTVANLETETEESETEKLKRKTISNGEKASNSENSTSGIINFRRNMTSAPKKDETPNHLNAKENLKLLNPFKQEKIDVDFQRILKNRKTFEKTKRKTIFDVSPISVKNKKTTIEEYEDHSKLNKYFKINLNKSENEEEQKEINDNNSCISIQDENLNFLPFFSVDDYKFINPIGRESCVSECLDKNDQRIAIKTISLKNKEKLDAIVYQIGQIYPFKHQNILQIYGISKKKFESNEELYISTELAKYNWTTDIRLRIKNSNHYHEKELFDIITQLIDALAFLQTKNTSHGNIKPENILFFKDNICKISDFSCVKESIISLEETVNEYFSSPPLNDALYNNIPLSEVNHDPIKSDVFSLGLCVLYASTLSFEPLQELRDIIDQNLCYNHVKQCLTNYSQTLSILVYRMLDLNEDLRFDFLDLQNYLNKS